MTRPYSLDLRERVVAAVISGLSCRAVAKLYAVSTSSVVRWTQRMRTTGSPAALAMGGKRPFALEPHREWLLGRLAEQPDLTLRALLQELVDRQVKVSYFAVWHFLRRARISFKKKPARQRAGSPRRRPPTGAVEAAPGKA